MSPLLVPGVTCWRKALAWRLSLIQDGEQAFASMAASIEAARETVFILGWDFDSRVRLRPGTQDEARLLPFLCACLDRTPALHIFVLIWDYSFIYSWEREPDPLRQMSGAHPHLHFALDDSHAVGASHHQKVVVVDDEVAYIGGIDLTTHRWDTPLHFPDDPRRLDSRQSAYGPFHDVQAAVAGPAANCLGELARARWQQKCASESRAVQPLHGSALSTWPEDLIVDAVDVEVAFARTFVEKQGNANAVNEIETLTLQTIAAAERWIYAENQYLTSESIQHALARRLLSENGPEIVLLLPEAESGWKEQSSMGILRARVLTYLRQRDRYGRLRLVTPHVRREALATSIEVHAKVLVVDDVLAKIGSSNLSRRSMRLDSECDLVIEKRDTKSAAFVTSVRNRLLAEHLGLGVRDVALALARHGSLCRLIDEQSDSAERRLIATPMRVDAPFDFAIFDGAVVDPPGPWSMTMILDRAVPRTLRHRLSRRWLRPLGWVTAVVCLGLLLRRSHFFTTGLPAAVSHAAWALAEHPVGAWMAVACFAAAATLFVPVTVLATATLAVFGLWPGVGIAWLGSLLSAVLSHALGHWGGPRIVAWLPDRIETGVRRFLKRQAFWAVVLMRLIPIGNFGALNMAAGAFRVPRRAFVFGNIVGMLPGLLGLGLVVGRVLAFLRRPTFENVVVAAVAAGGVTALTLYSKRRFRPPSPSSDGS
jgi:phospholipase D1/2